MRTSELIASKFHEFYEELAPSFGYETRDESAVAWDKVPLKNRRLMIAVVDMMIMERFISPAELTFNGISIERIR